MQKPVRNSILSVLGCIFIISGCSTTDSIVVTTDSPRASLVLQEPEQLRLRPVDWSVITADTVASQLQQHPVYFCLTKTGYENLSLNTIDTGEFIQQQTVTIQAYQTFVKETTNPN